MRVSINTRSLLRRWSEDNFRLPNGAYCSGRQSAAYDFAYGGLEKTPAALGFQIFPNATFTMAVSISGSGAQFFDSITKTLKKKGQVGIAGFGTFKVAKRKARSGRNPQDCQKTVNHDMDVYASTFVAGVNQQSEGHHGRIGERASEDFKNLE